MKELFDQILNEIRGMWRYQRLAKVTLWVICILGWAMVILLPDRYKATARVQVDTASALQPVLGKQIVVADVERQVEFVRQALLGTVQLEEVARETNLDIAVESEADRARLIDNLRESISISIANRGGRGPRDYLYAIEYEHQDRDKAVNVVTVLLNTFIEDTLGAKRSGNLAAKEFIDRQIQDNEQRLRESEDRLAEFKKRNADKLPGTEGGYFTRLQSQKDDLAASRRDLRVAQSKRSRLLEQASGEAAVITSVDGADVDLPENSLDARIRDYEARLEILLLDYTVRHPDVMAMRATVDRLKAEREIELEKLGVKGANKELAMLAANPVHQAILIALNDTDVEIATLEADIFDQMRAVTELQALIDEVPEVEAELARLNRDYEVIYSGYQELVQSRETQELSSRAYDSDEVNFEVIDPPSADFNPVAPNRPVLLVFVAIMGAGLAGGLTFVLSQLSPVVHDVEILREVAGIPVLGAISVVSAYHISFFGRKDVRGFVANIIFLGVMLVTVIGLDLFGPGLRGIAEGIL